jgi:gas vesicle protein
MVSEQMKDRWDSIEKELRAAMSKLADAIEKAREELPDAAKAINEEYLRMQEKLDAAVDKLRK